LWYKLVQNQKSSEKSSERNSLDFDPQNPANFSRWISKNTVASQNHVIYYRSRNQNHYPASQNLSLKVLFLYLFVPSRFEIVYNGKILFFMVHFIVITMEF